MKYLLTFIIIYKLFTITINAQTEHNIIPKPQYYKSAGGQVVVSDIKTIVIPKKNTSIKKLTSSYVSLLGLSSFKLVESDKPAFAKSKSLVFQIIPKELHPEAYTITTTKNGILLGAHSETGFFYALQTLNQLLEHQKDNKIKQLPFFAIEDRPQFSYRGLHLDVSRHFFDVASIKSYLDLMARYKFNKFHWHLTDDQGWRIEIKKFPLLTEVGAYRKGTVKGHANDLNSVSDNKTYGDYYTQEEIKEIVKYASDLKIEIIPEIEMPGHCSAALAAYPEFGCSGGPYEVKGQWGIFDDVFCSKDTTLWFVKEILNEVCDLFPGKYIHIGGDEVPKTKWKSCNKCQYIRKRQGLKNEEELQSYFIEQVGIFLQSKGKNFIGWDEILEGGLAPNAIVMSWRGIEGGIEAAQQKHQVVMCPGSHCYFDHYQSEMPKEPLAIGGYTPLAKVYAYNPVPEQLNLDEKKYILGAQANLWTEYIADFNHLTYMAYPRAIALAEVLWSNKENQDYTDFTNRLAAHSRWFKSNQYGFSTSYLDLSYQTASGKNGVEFFFMRPPIEGKILLETEKPEEGVVQDYTLSDTFILKENIDFSAWYQLPDKSLGRPLRLSFNGHLAAGKTIELSNPPSSKYAGSGPQCIVNGFMAPENKYGGSEWLGFEGENFEAVLDFRDNVGISVISVQFHNAISSWIHPPSELIVYHMDQNGKWLEANRTKVALDPKRTILTELKFHQQIKTSKLKILALNHGVIETELPGAGHKAWLFVGEIKVQ